MRHLLIGFCLLLASSFAWCQSSRNTWENLKALQPGDKIRVVESDHQTVSGAFVSANADHITLYEKSGTATIDRNKVRRVRVGGRRRRHLLIGIGVGAGAGAVYGGVAYNRNNGIGETRGENMVAGAIVGVAVGAVIGGLMPDFRTVYQAPGP